MAPIYRNDQVKVTIPSKYAEVGTHGKFLGCVTGTQPGGNIAIIRLIDGLEIQVPLLVLELDEEFVMDGFDWKTDIPTSDHLRHVKTIETVRQDDGTVYEVRGSSERWFIVRIRPSGDIKRTRFFANKREARRVFNELAGA